MVWDISAWLVRKQNSRRNITSFKTYAKMKQRKKKKKAKKLGQDIVLKTAQ